MIAATGRLSVATRTFRPMAEGTAEAVLARVRGAVDAALGVATWQLPASDVAALVEGLATEAARLGAARLRVLAEAQERRVAGDVGVSTAGWYAQVTHCRGREAVPTVELAVALGGHLAPAAVALGAGTISEAHAGVIHRVMTRLAVVLTPSLVVEATRVGGTRTPPLAMAWYMLASSTRLYETPCPMGRFANVAADQVDMAGRLPLVSAGSCTPVRAP